MESPVVIYEDNHLLVLEKPVGWLVQADITGDKTLTEWGKGYIKKKYNKPREVFLHPAHRIDRPVSGVVLFGRTSKALDRINKSFRDSRIKKTYIAIVEGIPPSDKGQLNCWLYKDKKTNRVKAFKRPYGQAKASLLNYQMLFSKNRWSLLKIIPITGRAHQIRVQLSDIGCPIVGDLKYGASKPLLDKGIALHANQLSFPHPIKKDEVTFRSKPIRYPFGEIDVGFD